MLSTLRLGTIRKQKNEYFESTKCLLQSNAVRRVIVLDSKPQGEPSYAKLSYEHHHYHYPELAFEVSQSADDKC